jgi:hypothetical protein
MKTIYKYPLDITDKQDLLLPEQAQTLTAQFQYGSLCLWAIVDTEAPKTNRTIFIFGTGHEIPAWSFRHIGTVQQENGLLDWHVFELKY